MKSNLILSDSIDKLMLVGPKYKKILNKLGIFTIRDFLLYFPSKYIDTSNIEKISQLTGFTKAVIKVKVFDIDMIRTKRGFFITEINARDDSGFIKLIWFNQRYISQSIKKGDEVLFYGKIDVKNNNFEMNSPEFEVIRFGENVHLGKITPIYPLTKGISSKWLRARYFNLIKFHSYIFKTIQETLPDEILEKYNLISINKAVYYLHNPKNFDEIEKARFRFAFEELYNIHIKLINKRIKRLKKKAKTFKPYKEKINKFLSSLEFTPTDDQINAIEEITSDFSKNHPANRLLQGDVGCGKTLVAGASMIPILETKWQCALLAPTAILAKQHYENFSKFFKKKYSIKLITGQTKKDETAPADIVIGTHALLHRIDKLFENLGFLIVDEQHRFGVEQRRLLANLKFNDNYPHTLTMTATPIPRSIALVLFGDLDITKITQMPQGRKPVKTLLVPSLKRKNMYKWLEEKIQKKSKIFWVCPLIEESEELDIKATEKLYSELSSKEFKKYSVDILHGKMSEKIKHEKIQAMLDDKTQILVSTTVIEVGMDIPDAEIIVIENAERFGLAQLHQLRGRVGRRKNQDSFCILFTGDENNKDVIRRLKFFAKTNNGLKVAEFDLSQRGPGEVYGTKQAGIPELRFASLSDVELLKLTKEAVETINK